MIIIKLDSTNLPQRVVLFTATIERAKVVHNYEFMMPFSPTDVLTFPVLLKTIMAIM